MKCPVRNCHSECVNEWSAPFCDEHLKLLHEDLRSEMNKLILDIAAAEAYGETDTWTSWTSRMRLVGLRDQALREVEAADGGAEAMSSIRQISAKNPPSMETTATPEEQVTRNE